jgi:hypothetical protein
MKSETNEKLTQGALTFICFTVYISLFVVVIADAFGNNPYEFLFG